MRVEPPMDQVSVSVSGRPRTRSVRRRSSVSDVPLNLVLFGPPGAGKGTQADRFAARHKIPKISTGEMLRKAVKDGTRLGAMVRTTLERGKLVSDDLTISLVADRLDLPDTARGFVLDGFPRTIPQAAALDAMMADRGGAARDRAGGAR